MNVRFHREPWDEETRTEFITGMGAILAAYLRDAASSGQADGDPGAEPAVPEPSPKHGRGRAGRSSNASNEVRHG